MNYDERIGNLTMQLNAASREVIIQDRILGQAREKVAELQGRINMLAELQETFVTEKDPTPASRSEQPKPEKKKAPFNIRKKPEPKPGPVPGTTSKYSQELIDYIKEFYPTTRRKKLVRRLNARFGLNLNESRVSDIIRKHGLTKSSHKKKDKGVDPDEAFDEGVDELDLDD